MMHDAVCDVSFPLRGTTIPADHAGPLYAAISQVIPALHGNEWAGIHAVRGTLIGNRQLQLTPKSSLVVRLPVNDLPAVVGLMGQQLTLAGSTVQLGPPTLWPLSPVPALASRIVIIQGYMEPEPFLEAAQRQLAEMGIQGAVSLVPRQAETAVEKRSAAAAGSPIRRTIRIHNKTVVGFAVAVEQLTAEESLVLQERGLGGRRRYGCGLFIPARW